MRSSEKSSPPRPAEAKSKWRTVAACVPESVVKEWMRLGFTHVWLMGVWRTGPRSRAAFLHQPVTRGRLAEILPGWTEADVPGSPYAIAAYRVAEELGGDAGLAAFREQLHRQGMRLVLDFVNRKVHEPFFRSMFSRSTVHFPIRRPATSISFRGFSI